MKFSELSYQINVLSKAIEVAKCHIDERDDFCEEESIVDVLRRFKYFLSNLYEEKIKKVFPAYKINAELEAIFGIRFDEWIHEESNYLQISFKSDPRVEDFYDMFVDFRSCDVDFEYKKSELYLNDFILRIEYPSHDKNGNIYTEDDIFNLLSKYIDIEQKERV